MISDLKYRVAFARVRPVGTARLRLLERAFASMEEAWQASEADLVRAGLEPKAASVVATDRRQIDPDAEMDALAKAGIDALTWHDDSYPKRLKEIPDPPPVLFVKGRIEAIDERSIAVVGTRKATAYGREAAHELTSDLAKNSITIVSGMARGIDSVAHKAALDAGGRTIAVLANGLDIIYPPENAPLFKEIAEKGAVISEQPLGERPNPQLFPRRNRLMSGMTLGTLVVEAGKGSGTLWTVRHALEQNREVFCVPGSIFSPASWGTNLLIQEGAKLVIDYRDILEELNLTSIASQTEMPMAAAPLAVNGEEQGLLKHIGIEPVHIDAICRGASLPVHQVSSALTLMELKGLVKQVGGMNYIRTRETAARYGD
ncbi:MAG: DNA-protecting protein DprA [SAR202 cluster bacterium]|nr:DNA-protecting protein DprA [SAR202 cluster bacterium]